jgi:hypothetical protein
MPVTCRRRAKCSRAAAIVRVEPLGGRAAGPPTARPGRLDSAEDLLYIAVPRLSSGTPR